MLTLKLLRDDPEYVVRKLAVKNFDAREIVGKIVSLDGNRRRLQTELDGCLSMQKQKAALIGGLMKEGKKAEADAVKAEVASLKEHSKDLERQSEENNTELNSLLVLLPNIPCDLVPEGKDSNDNVVVKTGNEIPDLGSDALPHWELAKKFDIIDFDLGVKLTGAGFPVYKGKGARLQRALINMFLDINTAAGYLEVEPPVMVNEASGFGTGQLPDKEGQMYHANLDNFYLVPTAEVPVTNYYRDDVLEARQLPIKLTAYTPCFRREAGSAGKDTRGILRVHQFDKVEMVKFVAPETSYDELEALVKDAEEVLTGLGLYFRVLELCSGDISFSAAKCYDLELWAPGQKGWLEVSSCSNFESFQARRASIRYRRADGKPDFVHTLNGSGVALPRLMIAILEQCQQADGSVLLPEAIRPYFGGDRLTPVR